MNAHPDDTDGPPVSGGDIDLLIHKIAEWLPFNSRGYPELKNATHHKVLAFAARHSSLHFAKTSGQLATLCEAADHGRDVDMQALRLIAIKGVVNALRVAELSGVRQEDFFSYVDEQMNSGRKS